MARALVVPLTEEELQELTRILLDRDEAGALEFLRRHLRPALHQNQDGGLKPALGATRPGSVRGSYKPSEMLWTERLEPAVKPSA